MPFKVNRLLTVFVVAISLLAVCKKAGDITATNNPAPTPIPVVTTEPEKIKDSNSTLLSYSSHC